mgnify:CR=1 FL=1
MHTSVFLQRVDDRDVGMAESGEDLRLALEARQGFGAQRPGFGEHLDGHAAFQTRVLGGEIDRAHPAPADDARIG